MSWISSKSLTIRLCSFATTVALNPVRTPLLSDLLLFTFPHHLLKSIATDPGSRLGGKIGKISFLPKILLLTFNLCKSIGSYSFKDLVTKIPKFNKLSLTRTESKWLHTISPIASHDRNEPPVQKKQLKNLCAVLECPSQSWCWQPNFIFKIRETTWKHGFYECPTHSCILWQYQHVWRNVIVKSWVMFIKTHRVVLTSTLRIFS